MLYLASRSPRRTELLSRLDRPFRALDLDVPERRAPGESALDYVQRVAADKARAGLVRVANDPEAVVLGSDTEVILDWSEAAIAAYVASGEPMGKAGAYAIQGGAERYIRHLAGSYSGVMGLPLQQTEQLLLAFESKGVAHV